MPVDPAVRAGQNDRPALPEERERLLDREQSASHVDREDLVEMVFRYLAQRSELANASIGEQNIDRSSFILYDYEEPVEIRKVRDVALNTRE